MVTACLAIPLPLSDLQVCLIVEGLHQLEVTVFGYNNPTGRCEDCSSQFLGGVQSCCDNRASTSCTGRDRCDSSFTYCLRTIGSTGSGCSYFGIRRSDSNTDDTHQDFSQSMVLGLENPLVLQGLTNVYLVLMSRLHITIHVKFYCFVGECNMHAPRNLHYSFTSFAYLFIFQGVQLYIEITDYDFDVDNDLIDILLINHNLSAGQISPRKTYTGNFSFITMDLSIMSRCVGNFYSSDCSRCLSGFTGTMCNIKTTDCTARCSGHGQCLDGVPSLICDCNPGFAGEECETNIDDCIRVTCSGNGQCVDGILSYTCDCNPGFTGEDCEVNIDDCVGINCSGNGQCVDGVLSYTCNCNPGFTGDDCEVNIDDCVGINCSGNGICLDGLDTFTCQCNSRFGGTFCTEFEGIMLWFTLYMDQCYTV